MTDHKTKSELTTKSKADTDYATKPQIVIVEDCAEISASVKLQLEPYFKLKFFTHAEDAFSYVLDNNAEVELIISDHDLPAMSGMQLLSMIKKDPALKHMHFILQSASQIEGLINQYQVQPDFYLQKPWTKEQMKSAIRQALGLSNLW